MITNLRISGLGVIAAADVDFGPGLVAFTGETGAGKTMLVSALGLVLGDRADHALVGEQDASVELRVAVPPNSVAAQIITEAGGALDDGEILLARTLTVTKRSRAFASGRSVPAATLSQVGDRVAQRHNQNEQIHLRQPARQRLALDDHAGAELIAALTGYRSGYARYLRMARDLARWQDEQRELAREAHMLTDGVTEIDRVSPRSGEDGELAAQAQRLANAEDLRTSLGSAKRALAGTDDEGAIARLALAHQTVQKVGGDDALLSRVLDLLGEAQAAGAEAAAELGSALAGLDADPGRLEELNRRRADINSLLRRFGPEVDDVLAWRDSARAKLAAADPDGIALERQRRELRDLAQQLGGLAADISRRRVEAAQTLGAAVSTELAELSMPQARLIVRVSQRPDERGLRLADGRRVSFGEHGVDDVEFLLKPHAGAEPAPLGVGASGGEMSRVLLALNVVLSRSSPPAVFVFDEIDAGIGGRAAVEVGRRLARLALHSQVFVVTHLAQVAAFASQQVVISKDSDGMVSSSSVVEVTGDERARELTRMLSGLEGSDSGRAHAEELLARAELERTGSIDLSRDSPATEAVPSRVSRRDGS